MYTPPPDEFALLNNDEKLQIVENLENAIELQRQQFFNNYNEEIPIRSYYPKINYLNFQTTINRNEKAKKNNIENNCLLSSSSFSSIENEKSRNKVINKAKTNIIQIKKNFENFNNKFEIDEKENKNLKTISNDDDLNNSQTIKEVNYIIESTTNSYDSDRKSHPVINNYMSISKNPLNIEDIKKYEENGSKQIRYSDINNYNFNYHNYLKNNNSRINNNNNNDIYKDNNENNNIKIIGNDIFDKNKKKDFINSYYFINSENNSINNKNINKSINKRLNGRNKKIKKAISHQFRKYYHNKSNNNNNLYSKKIYTNNQIQTNNISKINDKLKINLPEKIEMKFPLNEDINNHCLYNQEEDVHLYNHINNNNKIKKHLSFNKKLNNINDEIINNSSKNKQSRNNKNRNMIKYKSLSNRNKINPKDVSIRLYNMHQIIIDKINKKKQEIEKQELKNCSFIPKINYKSKKIVEMLEYKNKHLLYINEENEKIKDTNNTDDNLENINNKLLINGNSKVIDLIPKYNKTLNFINNNIFNEQEIYTGLSNTNKKQDNNNEYEELKQYTFKTNNNFKNKNNYYRNNNKNYKYNTINLSKEKKNVYNILNQTENNYNNKPRNIKQLYSILNNKNVDIINNQEFINADNLTPNDNLYIINLYNDDKKMNNENEKINYYYNSKYDFVPKTKDYSNNLNKSKIYYTEENINKNSNNNNIYFDNNYIYHKRAMSSSKSECNKINDIYKNKIINSKSFINKYYYNENDNCTFKPFIYKNKKYLNKQSHYGNHGEILAKINEDIQKKNERIQLLRNMEDLKEMSECVFHPKINEIECNFNNKNKSIKVKEVETYAHRNKLRQEKMKLEDRNDRMLANRDRDMSEIQKLFNQYTYKNNYNNNNGIYIKKNITRNFSYSNRNNNMTFNDNLKSNNRIIINKILMDE